ncbi:MAG: DUF2000 domain-containing protein [Mesorhizobium sp.]|nr:MAG: DUF2000 domain-containing protein [Mesorhizobium sp.]
MLAAPASELGALRAKALARDIDYAAFGEVVGTIETDALRYVGIGVFGPRRAVGKVVGRYGLLK